MPNVEKLIEYGFLIDPYNESHIRNFAYIVKKGVDRPLLSYLLEKGLATQKDHPEIIEALIQSWSDITKLNLFLEHGLNINAADPYNSTLLFVEAGSNRPLVHMEALINLGANVNGSSNNSPLMVAAYHNFVDKAKLLIAHGADVNLIYNGESALTYACENGTLKLLNVLLKAGAKVDINQADGRTALLLAVKNKPNIALEILKHTKKINHADQLGNTPLLHACEFGFEEVLKELVDKGADVNIKNKKGITALSEAATINNLESVSYLLDKSGHLMPVEEIKASLMMTRDRELNAMSALIGNYLLMNLVNQALPGNPVKVRSQSRMRI